MKVGMDLLLGNYSKKGFKSRKENDWDKKGNGEDVYNVALIKKTVNEKESISNEIGIFSVSTISAWFKDHIQKMYEKTCEETFMKTEYNSIMFGLDFIQKQSMANQKIVVSSQSEVRYANYISEIGFHFLKLFLPNFQEICINQLNKENQMVIISLFGGLEHCFRNRSLLFQALNSYLCPPTVLESLKMKFPYAETMKGIPIEEYEMFTSPWANTLEDEEYVKQTYDYLEELIEDDQEVSKMLTFLVFFSPLTDNLSQEASVVLKQFQSKLTMVIYNYLMSKPGSDNLRVLDKLTKFVQIIHRLRKCGKILKSRKISPLGLEFELDPLDLNAIELCQL